LAFLAVKHHLARQTDDAFACDVLIYNSHQSHQRHHSPKIRSRETITSSSVSNPQPHRTLLSFYPAIMFVSL
jgi:hypothetical protein